MNEIIGINKFRQISKRIVTRRRVSIKRVNFDLLSYCRRKILVGGEAGGAIGSEQKIVKWSEGVSRVTTEGLRSELVGVITTSKM
jgi:hypothetical protein